MSEYKVWVGCLPCYNNGDLVGDWFDAGDSPQSEEEFNEAVPAHVKLQAADVNPHEELWVFDHENSPVEGEYSPWSAKQYAEWLGDLAESEAEIFGRWLADNGPLDEDAVERFRGSYMGCFEEGADYLADLYPEADLPSWAQGHYWEILRSMFKDCLLGGDVYTIETGYQEVHVFSTH
ncbi:antirestriction protein ArdA [Arthrobacter sp. 31Y]|uniref:antirestriction protein ArdA n=1 Tax=Arthrobacter sp. 31Y TaxID=1115632 RepID=UPI0004654A42|nr:antirestriction protein ArdA [Arthrobacter sp. 31Y]